MPTVSVTSDGPRVAIGGLFASPDRMGTWWEFTVICKEVAGCHDELEFVISYRAEGRPASVRRTRVIDLPSLGQLKIRFLERQRHPVDAVDGVKVHVVQSPPALAGSPRPAGTQRRSIHQ